MKPKLARKSFDKDPYVCQKPWPEDCFCQCGGQGIVLVSTDSKDDTKSKNYKTAFFEAFPKSPHCFIRGEGDFIEEAEAKAFAKYQQILSCPKHEWDRKGRTDGYCYCTKCPLSGTYLEPLTKCAVCQTPTSGYTNKDQINYCRTHYFELSADDAIGNKSWMGISSEELKNNYLVDQYFYKLIMKIKPDLTNEEYEKISDYFIKIQAELNAKYNPLFGPATKTPQEIHDMLMADLPLVAEIVYKRVIEKP